MATHGWMQLKRKAVEDARVIVLCDINISAVLRHLHHDCVLCVHWKHHQATKVVVMQKNETSWPASRVHLRNLTFELPLCMNCAVQVKFPYLALLLQC